MLHHQIRTGQPLTITHPDMTRYFMSIEEAVNLVLHAAAHAKAGDICILKMGEPIAIVEIAKKVIALMGLREDEVPMVFTGLRAGEKLFEELYFQGDEVQTDHPDVMVVPAQRLQRQAQAFAHFDLQIKRLIQMAQSDPLSSRPLLFSLIDEKTVEQRSIQAA